MLIFLFFFYNYADFKELLCVCFILFGNSQENVIFL